MTIAIERQRARPLAAAALMTLATLLATGCGGGGASSAPAAANDAALQASQPGKLLKQVQSLLRARDQERQTAPDVPVDGIPVPGAALPVSAAGAPVSFSNTTVQEAGVDEEDLLKTDGTSVYALDAVSQTGNGALSERLLVSRRNAAGDIVPVQVLDLPADPSIYAMARGLLLAAPAHRLVALSQSLSPIGDPIPCTSTLPCPLAGAAAVFMPTAMQSKVQLQFIDLDAVGNAALGKHVAIDGRFVGSRLIGNVVFLVTTHAPRLAFELLPPVATHEEKETTLAKMTSADFLPTWQADGAAAQQLVADTDCYVQPANSSFGLQVADIPPNSGDAYPEHDHAHDGQEEVYLLLRGSADLHLPGRVVALDPETFVRVGPRTRRRLRSGENGARVLMIGAMPGRAYEPQENTPLGAPETLPCPTASTSLVTGSAPAQLP